MKKNSEYYKRHYLNERCKIYFNRSGHQGVMIRNQKKCIESVAACVLQLIYSIQGGRFKSAGTSGGRHSMKTNAIRYFFFGNSITVYLPLLSIASLSF